MGSEMVFLMIAGAVVTLSVAVAVIPLIVAKKRSGKPQSKESKS